MSNGGFLFNAAGVVKALEDHFILPGHSGDVVCNISSNFLWYHAEHTDLQHCKKHKHIFIHQKCNYIRTFQNGAIIAESVVKVVLKITHSYTCMLVIAFAPHISYTNKRSELYPKAPYKITELLLYMNWGTVLQVQNNRWNSPDSLSRIMSNTSAGILLKKLVQLVEHWLRVIMVLEGVGLLRFFL